LNLALNKPMQEENTHTQACYGDNSGPKQKCNSFPDIGNEPPESADIGHDENPEPDLQVRDFFLLNI